MKREIKFRAYSSHNHKMYPVSNIEWDITPSLFRNKDLIPSEIETIKK